jgi:hypothetical protein
MNLETSRNAGEAEAGPAKPEREGQSEQAVWPNFCGFLAFKFVPKPSPF